VKLYNNGSMNRHKTILIFLTAMICLFSKAQSAYYETLPKGVRLFALRQIHVFPVEDYFHSDMTVSPYGVKTKLDAQLLSEVEIFWENYFKNLKLSSSGAYEAFSAGSWQLQAKTEVDVTGSAFAYGLTNRVTAYVTIPFYKASVNIAAVRTEENNYAQVQNILSQQGAHQPGVMLNTEDLPDVDGTLMQSVLTQFYGYEPMGSWQGSGLGDIELTMKYRLTDWSDSGLAASGGVVAPTGREDNPDIIQDFAFGQGYWAIFGEFGGGHRFHRNFSYDSFARLTLGLPDKRTLRAPKDYEFPLSREKEEFTLFPGPKFDYAFLFNYHINDWLTLSPEYNYFYKQKSVYKSDNEKANDILALYSEEEKHTLRLTLGISSISSYLSKNFIFPFNVNLSAETVVRGKNTPKSSMVYGELRLMF
jgi:hypothetical protein